MLEFDDRAKIRLDKYLNKVKVYLRDCKDVSVDDILQNIIDHIANETVNSPRPISEDELEKVLKKLGSPDKWVPQEELSLWKKLVMRLQAGPEDWRLSYLSFALFFIAILCLVLCGRHKPIIYENNVQRPDINLYQQMNKVSEPHKFITVNNQKPHNLILEKRYGSSLFVIFLLASFIVSRAVIAVAIEHQELLGKKWLIYPSLLTVYVLIFGLLMFWPAIILGSLANQFIHSKIWFDITNTATNSQEYLLWILIIMSLGLWWAIFWGTISKSLMIKNTFRPFFDTTNQTLNKVLAFAGIGIVMLSIIALILTFYV